ncbi:MAG: DUF2231 domain-containing protein [Actinobacteria bacterium]|nr:MAG: DUF2231 domain-containing protein [Actinomycetota bacterium]
MRRFSFRPSLTLRGRKFKGLRGFAGKPFHPPLTDVPIGAYTVVAGLDVLSKILHSGHPVVAAQLYKAGTFTLWGGALVSLATALTGFWDWWKSSEPGTQARRTINAHAWTMITATVLVVVDLILRTWVYDTNPVVPGRVLVISLVIFVLITIGGTLGGELTYDYGFNVETAGDSPVWAKSEADVMPDGSTRGGPTPVQPG